MASSLGLGFVLSLLSLVMCLGHVVFCAHILLLPLPDTSQCRQMVSIGRELAQRGHQVILFVPDYFRVRRCTEPSPVRKREKDGGSRDIRVVEFGTAPETADYVSERLERLGDEVMNGGTGLLGASRAARDVMDHVCSSYITESGDDLDELQKIAGGKIDFVLLDGSPVAHCLTLIPAYLGTQFAAVGSYIDPYDSNNPIPSAYYPAPLSGLGGRRGMGFWHRLNNFLTYASMHIRFQPFGGFSQGNALGPGVGRLNPHRLIRKAAVYLENSDHVVDYPRALFPNFLQVGGLTTSPAKPLPAPLAKFFDGAGGAGVIVVSLGPFVFAPNQNLESKLMAAFQQLDARVLLRLNVSQSSQEESPNVQVVSWFPQNDALGHPATKLFISHCGKNSFFEALYHGVPLLCCSFAFTSDVLGTGQRVAEYGVGQALDLTHATGEQIAHAIKAVLQDQTIIKRAKSASKMFHSRHHTPVQRAAHAVEFVLKYGADSLRPRSVDMNFFQHAGLDIALFLFVTAIVVTVVTGLLLYVYVLPLILRRHQEPADVSPGSLAASDASPKPPAKSRSSEVLSKRLTQIVMYSLMLLTAFFYIFA